MNSSIDISQVELFPREFREMEEVQVWARLASDIRAERVRVVATVVCSGKAPDTYLVRTKAGRIFTAHWTEMTSIER